MKTYTIDDEGDSFELAMFEGGVQVAGAVFPIDMGVDAAMELAMLLGEAFQSAQGGYPRAPIS